MSAKKLPDSKYDNVGDFYLTFIRERLSDPDSFFRQNVSVITELLGDIRGRRICDLACGEGFFSRILSDRGAVVTGVDISENLLVHARAQTTEQAIEFIRDDAQALKRLQDESFDAVVCHMALMDIPDVAATLRAVYRVLKEEGTFVYCVLHPCFETPFNADTPPHEVDEAGNLVAIRVSRYRQEGKWFSDGSGMRGTLGSIHRMLSTYLNNTVDAGFRIEQVREPLLSPPQRDTFSNQLRSLVPQVLIVKTKKASC